MRFGPVSSWNKLLQEAEPRGHLVHFYKSDERLLTKNVGNYIRDGLIRGEALVVIATKEHNREFSRWLQKAGIDMEAAVRQGCVVSPDAHQMLDQSMVRGRLDWSRFDRAIGDIVRQKAGPGRSGLRVYGEMVDVLWKAGDRSAAIQLEEFWNRLASSHPFNLFCAYPIDVFDDEFRIDALDALLCAHTHLLPTGTTGDLEIAINRAMDEVLGPRVDSLRLLIKSNYRPSWAVLPKAEAVVLWLRNNLPEDAEAILSRARQYYRPSHTSAASPGNQTH